MLTGGEPLVRKRDVVRLAEKHDDCLFNVFTNASLVDQAFCDDVKRVGNIIFSVSLESYEAGVNDGRRGNGSFDEVMRAFDLMHANGLLRHVHGIHPYQHRERLVRRVLPAATWTRGCR